MGGLRVYALLAAACLLMPWCAHASSPAVLNLGWLEASQTDEGWFVHRVSLWLPDADDLESGDTIYSVDGRRIETLNALSASNELDWIESGASYVEVLRHGITRTLRLRHSDGALSFRFVDPLHVESTLHGIHREAHRYARDERVTRLELPNATVVEPGPERILIHIWSPT